MSLIQRPVKQFGFREYLDDYNAAPLNPTPPPTHIYHIHPAEVDGDLDTMYADYNGGITDPNIAPGANINGSKLADASIPIGKLATTGFVRAGITPSLSFNTAIHVIGTLPALTTTGGRVRLEADSVTVVLANGATGFPVTFTWYEDGVLIATITAGVQNLNAAAIAVPLPLPTYVREGATAAAHVYQLKGVTGDITVTIASDPTHPGELYATEVP